MIFNFFNSLLNWALGRVVILFVAEIIIGIKLYQHEQQISESDLKLEKVADKTYK